MTHHIFDSTSGSSSVRALVHNLAGNAERNRARVASPSQNPDEPTSGRGIIEAIHAANSHPSQLLGPLPLAVIVDRFKGLVDDVVVHALGSQLTTDDGPRKAARPMTAAHPNLGKGNVIDETQLNEPIEAGFRHGLGDAAFEEVFAQLGPRASGSR